MTDNRLIHGDCLEVMKDIPDNSINLCLFDPPYNIGKAKWDKWKKQEDYISFMGKVFIENQRVLKDNGSMYFFHNDMVQVSMLMEWIRLNTKLVFKQFIVWNKIDPSFYNYGYVQQRLSIDMMRNYYGGYTEYCLFYTFQDETGLNTVMLDTNNFSTLRGYFKQIQDGLDKNIKRINSILGHRKAEHSFYWKSTQWDMPTQETYQELIDVFKINTMDCFKPYEDLRQEYEELRQEYEELRQEYEELRYTFKTTITKESLRANSNVWLYPPAKNIGHITPKPVELIENILKHSSNEQDIILDCFSGSSTTAIACLNTDRNYICIEKDEEYYKLSKQRIKDHVIQERLF